MTRIYLDSCSLQRPLDTKTQVRIAIEAEAILGVIAQVEEGGLDLVSSDALEYEADQSPVLMRREHAHAMLSKASAFVALDQGIENRAKELIAINIKPMDALHIASAEAGDCDFFCTCDDRLLCTARHISDLRTKVVSPVELVQELGI